VTCNLNLGELAWMMIHFASRGALLGTRLPMTDSASTYGTTQKSSKNLQCSTIVHASLLTLFFSLFDVVKLSQRGVSSRLSHACCARMTYLFHSFTLSKRRNYPEKSHGTFTNRKERGGSSLGVVTSYRENSCHQSPESGAGLDPNCFFFFT
jgi:hypothetical protein